MPATGSRTSSSVTSTSSTSGPWERPRRRSLRSRKRSLRELSRSCPPERSLRSFRSRRLRRFRRLPPSESSLSRLSSRRLSRWLSSRRFSRWPASRLPAPRRTRRPGALLRRLRRGGGSGSAAGVARRPVPAVLQRPALLRVLLPVQWRRPRRCRRRRPPLRHLRRGGCGHGRVRGFLPREPQQLQVLQLRERRLPAQRELRLS